MKTHYGTHHWPTGSWFDLKAQLRKVNSGYDVQKSNHNIIFPSVMAKCCIHIRVCVSMLMTLCC